MFRAGGAIVPDAAGTGYATSASVGGAGAGAGAGGSGDRAEGRRGVSTAVQPRRRDGTNEAPSLVPRSARGKPTRAAPKIGADNVGFRMLKKAGWTEGTGLGKDREGPVEPLGAWAKADRKGVGHEAGAGHVVGDPERQGGQTQGKGRGRDRR